MDVLIYHNIMLHYSYDLSPAFENIKRACIHAEAKQKLVSVWSVIVNLGSWPGDDCP